MIALSKKMKTTGSNASKLQLTSLVDVMTILLVFLIKSFSAEGNIVTSPADLKLPESSSKTTARQVKGIKITATAVMNGDKVIAPLSSFKDSDSLLIPLLSGWMSKNIDLITNEKRELMIQSDKNLPFDIIKKVMYTCSQAGIADFTILVLREE